MGMLGSLFSSGVDNAADKMITPVNLQQLGQSYDNTQTGLQQQQALIQALQAQNGIQNQSDVYAQLQGIVNGTGPNPAQAMLNQATANNTANQAALMAGQRGAGANVGLLARQAGMQGAANQQNAIGQGATLQANQSLNALNGAGNIAGQQVSNQANATSTYGQLANQNYASQLGAIGNYNNGIIGGQSDQNKANQALFDKQLGTVAGIGQAVAGGGGAPKAMAAGGMVPANNQNQMANLKEGKSGLFQHLKMSKGGPVPGEAKVEGNSYANDTVPAMLSPGEIVIPRSVLQSEDPINNAAAFVAQILGKNKGLKK